MSGLLEPVGVTVASLIKAGTITKPVSKTTKVKLDECFGTAKANEKNDDDCSDEDVDDGRRARSLNFFANKYSPITLPTLP